MPVPTLTPAVLRFLGQHHHVASRAQLRALGLSDHQLDGLLAAGLLEPRHRGVHALVGVIPTVAQQALAACLAAPAAVVSHATAARLRGWPGISDHRLHVTVPLGDHAALRPAVVHRSSAVGGADVVVRRDGIRLTSPARTLFDLAATTAPHELAALVDHVLARGECDLAALWAAAHRLARRGRPGSGRFVQVLRSRPAAATAARIPSRPWLCAS